MASLKDKVAEAAALANLETAGQEPETPITESQEPETPVTEIEEEVKHSRRGVVVTMIQGIRMTHPVTGQVFTPNKRVPILDLDHPDNVFVRHQLDAGIFEIVKD